MSDTQKEQLYFAESAFRDMIDNQFDTPLVTLVGSTFPVPLDRKFASLESVQSYVNLLTRHFKLSPVVCRAMRKDAHQKATYCAGVISLPTVSGRWSMREVVVLHELAHHMSSDHHGPQFAAKFIELVQYAMGEQAAFILKVMFYESGVKIA